MVIKKLISYVLQLVAKIINFIEFQVGAVGVLLMENYLILRLLLNSF